MVIVLIKGCNYMKIIQLSLFPEIAKKIIKKDLMQFSYVKQRKAKTNNMHLSLNIEKNDNGIPIVKPYNGSIPDIVVPYTCRGNAKNVGLHFFVDDYRFESLWNNLEHKTKNVISKYQYVFAPDYSCFVDEGKVGNLIGIYKNRFITAYWQQYGIKVIPVASWGNADSFSYCFEGLPRNSIIAVGSVAVSSCKASIALWQYGIKQLENQLAPTKILVYGKKIEVPNLSTNIYYYPDYLTKFRKNEKIIQQNLLA